MLQIGQSNLDQNLLKVLSILGTASRIKRRNFLSSVITLDFIRHLLTLSTGTIQAIANHNSSNICGQICVTCKLIHRRRGIVITIDNADDDSS